LDANGFIFASFPLSADMFLTLPISFMRTLNSSNICSLLSPNLATSEASRGRGWCVIGVR
jgi:hypothetical protein